MNIKKDTYAPKNLIKLRIQIEEQLKEKKLSFFQKIFRFFSKKIVCNQIETFDSYNFKY